MWRFIPLRPVSNRADALSLRNRVKNQGDFRIKVKQKFLNMNKQKEKHWIYGGLAAKIYNQKRKNVTLYSDFSWRLRNLTVPYEKK